MKKIATAILVVAALGLLSGCPTVEKKKRKAKGAATRPPPTKAMTEAPGDVSYQAFVGRLRQAIANHDIPLIASMMTPNFGYSLEPIREGDGVFKYWDENGLWPELESIVKEKFVPSGEFMVAPPQFAEDPTNYRGYRAGVTRVGGSWRFAYFVSG